MSQPSNRQGLIDYCLRQLGAPVLEINIADEQIDDLVDDAIQYFQERHYDGVMQMPLRYQITQDDINRGRAPAGDGGAVGITTTTVTQTVGNTSSFAYQENGNYIPLPDSIIGVNKIYRFPGTQTMSSGMFNVKYQLMLNDVYFFDSLELLSYAMVKTKLEDIDFLLNPLKQIRFNIRQGRLYIDADWSDFAAGDYIIIDCWRILDPNDFSKVYNDRFIKKYLTATMKRQWGQNLIKFQGVKLPGGIELNGRQIYDDAVQELKEIQEQMLSTYEIPPLDLIG
jgi:hypothetical protein|tara:strand:+ start:668 stop:1513 length:846 start_codon:yes stop_codon:yes gene_type:complete